MTTVNATLTRRCHAIINETINYEIKKADIDERTAKGMSVEEAVEDCISNGLCERDGYEVEVDDIVAEHESEVSVN